jgi:HTH-type transcriptional regulator / antitoxin HigA
MANIHPIRTDEDYEEALAEIESLVTADPAPDTPEGERLELLAILIEAYEEQHHPIPVPDDPVEVILYYMEKDGLRRKDLEAFIGSRARVSDVLNRKRSLSLSMIRRLSAGLGIPTDFLISPLKSPSQASGRGAQIFTR